MEKKRIIADPTQCGRSIQKIACLALIWIGAVSLVVRSQDIQSEVTTSIKLGSTLFTIERFGDDSLPERYVLKLNNRNIGVIEDRFVDVDAFFDLSDLRKV